MNQVHNLDTIWCQFLKRQPLFLMILMFETCLNITHNYYNRPTIQVYCEKC